MDGGLQLVGGETEHVRIHILIECDGVLLHHAAEHLDLVAQPRRLLEFQLGAGLLHLPRELGDVRLAEPSGHHADQPFTHAPMLLRADTADAGSRAFADRRQQTGAVRQLRLVEHVRRTGAHRERLEQPVQAFAHIPHLGVGTEVPGVMALAAARDPYARHLLADRDRQIRVGLVVTQLDVEARLELLDPRVLQRERLQFGADHGPFQAAGGEHHGLRARVQQVQRLEVVAQAVAQVLGLAYVDDTALAVAPFVDAGFGGDVTGFRTEQVAGVAEQRRAVGVHVRGGIRRGRVRPVGAAVRAGLRRLQ